MKINKENPLENRCTEVLCVMRQQKSQQRAKNLKKYREVTEEPDITAEASSGVGNKDSSPLHGASSGLKGPIQTRNQLNEVMGANFRSQ